MANNACYRKSKEEEIFEQLAAIQAEANAISINVKVDARADGAAERSRQKRVEKFKGHKNSFSSSLREKARVFARKRKLAEDSKKKQSEGEKKRALKQQPAQCGTPESTTAEAARMRGSSIDSLFDDSDLEETEIDEGHVVEKQDELPGAWSVMKGC